MKQEMHFQQGLQVATDNRVGGTLVDLSTSNFKMTSKVKAEKNENEFAPKRGHVETLIASTYGVRSNKIRRSCSHHKILFLSRLLCSVKRSEDKTRPHQQ